MTPEQIEIISKIVYQNEMLIDMNWQIINSIIQDEAEIVEPTEIRRMH